MLKRITKVTGLLLAAASVVSMVPAMAADVKKIEAQEGAVHSALAYYTDAGTYYIDAELNGEDEAVYCVKGGKYTKLEKVEPGDKITDFIDNLYLEMNYGEYYVDINTGERSYDIVTENNYDQARTLKKKIKKDNNGRFKKSNYDDNVVEPTIEFDGCTWSEYAYDLEHPQIFGNYTKEKSCIYGDKDGNYFDGDYNLGKLGVVTTGCAVSIADKEVTLKNTNITIKNTEDTYEINDTDGNEYELKALITNTDSRNKGTDYLGRTVYLSIWIKEKGADDSAYTNITDKVEFGSSKNHHPAPISISDDYGKYTKVTQKMSMETASDDVDGIKYAKNSTIYFSTDEDGADKTSDMLMFYSDVYAWEPDFSEGELKARTINCKSNNGYNYIDISDIDEVDVDITSMSDLWNPVTIGAAGLSCISDGYVKKFVPSEKKFVNLYKVDGGMNRINVCWEYNLVVWNEDDEIYSIIDEPLPGIIYNATIADKTASATVNISTTAGWVKATDSTWSYIKADGTKAAGWLQYEHNWYYLNESGIMQTGWINDRGIWYYCNSSGAMLADATIDGYVLGTDGAWIK